MVDKETFEIEAEAVAALVTGGTIRRGYNGEWTLDIQIDGDLRIDGERTLPLRGILKIKGRQNGRKANPANNWGKGGGFKKKKGKK